MSLFGKLFGRGKSASQPAPPLNPPVDMPDAPKTLKVWDEYGRICEISREDWRTKILPDNFRAKWNKPEELAALLNNALNDGFVSDCLEPARQLYRIDPQPQRGATYLAAILLQLKRFDEAARVVSETMQKHGEDGVLLTNLAKAQSGQGNEALAEQTLWHALELDPNQDNGLLWYAAIHRGSGGEAANVEALRRLSSLPGSWRAQLWLARDALKSRQVEAAMKLYLEALVHAPTPAPIDLLQQISGDLGNAGYLPEILQLVAPRFNPVAHGLSVGNNLIKAHLDLGQLDAARRILDQLYAQNRGDWKEHLSFWDTEIAKARLAVNTADRKEPANVAMLTIEGPVWLKPDSPAAELFPAHAGGITVAFLGSSADVPTNSKRVQQQLADAPGRMSRALPLFLAEQVAFHAKARVETLIPWLTGETPGFALMGAPCTDEDAAQHARSATLKSDYVVITHVKPITDPWTIELRLVRTIDGKCLGTLATQFPVERPEDGIPALAEKLLPLLRDQAEAELLPAPPNYQIPGQAYFGSYLLRLEQLLGLRCAGMDGVPSGFFHGEREVIDGNLQLCLDHPQNVGVRILLAQTLVTMKRVRPAVVAEYKERIARLQREKPLAEPANGVVQRIINEVLAP